jgi:hypothetical protein
MEKIIKREKGGEYKIEQVGQSFSVSLRKKYRKTWILLGYTATMEAALSKINFWQLSGRGNR